MSTNRSCLAEFRFQGTETKNRKFTSDLKNGLTKAANVICELQFIIRVKIFSETAMWSSERRHETQIQGQ